MVYLTAAVVSTAAVRPEQRPRWTVGGSGHGRVCLSLISHLRVPHAFALKSLL